MSNFWTGLIVGVLVDEARDISPWLSQRIVRQSADRWDLEHPSPDDELESMMMAKLDETPEKLAKLCHSLRFALEVRTHTFRKPESLLAPINFRRACHSKARLAQIGLVEFVGLIATLGGIGHSLLASIIGGLTLAVSALRLRGTVRSQRNLEAVTTLEALADPERQILVRRSDQINLRSPRYMIAQSVQFTERVRTS